MALTNEQLQASMDANIDPIKQTAPIEEPVDTKELIKQVTKVEVADKQVSEAESEAFKKSIQIGWNKGVSNVLDFINWTPTGSMLGGESLEEIANQQKIKTMKLIEQRDAIYRDYKDDVSIGTYIAAGAVEGLVNVPETIISAGLATVTGGGSLVYQVGAEVVKDLGMSTYDTYKYYGRMPTPTELLATAGLSAITSVGPIKTAKAIKNKFGKEVAEEVVDGVTDKIAKTPVVKTLDKDMAESTEKALVEHDMLNKAIMDDTDKNMTTKNIVKEMDEVADQDLTKGDSARANATQSGIKSDMEEYSIDDARAVEGNTILSREYKRWSEDKVTDAVAERNARILEIDAELKTLKKPIVEEPIIVGKVKEARTPKPSYSKRTLERIKKGKKLTDNDLKRKAEIEAWEAEAINQGEIKATGKELEDLAKQKPKVGKREAGKIKRAEAKEAKLIADTEAKRVARVKELTDERGAKLKVKNAPKDFVQAKVQEADFVNRIAENSKETIKAYSDASYEGKGGVGFGQVEEAVKNENNRFIINSDFAENEMINQLGITPSQYIDSIDGLDYAKTKDWINGKTSMTIENGYSAEEVKFWTSRVDDADLINGMGGKLHTYDISDAEGFKGRYTELYESNSDDISIIRGDGKTNKEAVAHIGGKTPDADKRIAGQMLLGDEEGVIRFNQLIDEATNSPAQFKSKYGVEAEQFVKSGKDILTKYAPDEGAYLRLNQSMNKQKFMVEYYDHYKGEFGGDIEKVNLDDIIEEGQLPELMGKINPTFEKGYFGEAMKNATDEEKAKKFYEFISGMADTRDNTRYTGRHRTFSSLKEITGDVTTDADTKGQNLLNIFTDAQPQFLKNNSELVQDMFTKQSGDIARIMTYGSPSPHRVSNQYKFKIKKIMTDKMGKTINDAENEGLQKVNEIVEGMLTNTQTGKKTTKKIGIAGISSVLRHTVGRGIMNLTGAAELGVSNYSNVLARAMHYNGGSKAVSGAIKHDILKPLKNLGMGKDMANAKYHIAQTIKNTDLSKHNVLTREIGESKSGFLFRKANKKYDDISYSIQKYSDKQAKKFGEGFTVQTFDNMANTYGTLDDNLKAHFKNFGIGEHNYDEFAKHVKGHIAENDSYVDIDKLMNSRGANMSAMGDIDMDDALVQSYYSLSNNIGNPIANSVLNANVKSEFDEWASMFRRYSRAMNADGAKKMLYYSDAKGVQRNRYMGARKQDIGALTSDTGTGIAVATALAVGGAGYTLGRDLIYSNRKIDERLAIVQVKAEEIYEGLKFDELSVEEAGELVGVFAKYAAQGVNPFDLDQLSSESALIGIAGRLKKTYDTFTDEEKITYGTNVEEGFAEFAYLVTSSLLSNAVSKNVKAYTDIKDPRKVYNFTKDQNIAFASIVRTTTKAEFNSITNKTRKESRATADYLEENNRSYNELPNTKKKDFEKIMDSMNVPNTDRKEFETEFALHFTNIDNEDIPETMRKVYGLNYEEYTEYVKANPIEKTKFDNMSSKKKDYFGNLMEYKGITDQAEIEQLQEEFYDRFKSVKRSQLSKQLEEGFGINREDFNNWYDDRN